MVARVIMEGDNGCDGDVGPEGPVGYPGFPAHGPPGDKGRCFPTRWSPLTTELYRSAAPALQGHDNLPPGVFFLSVTAASPLLPTEGGGAALLTSDGSVLALIPPGATTYQRIYRRTGIAGRWRLYCTGSLQPTDLLTVIQLE
jgi:hypothetical protein